MIKLLAAGGANGQDSCGTKFLFQLGQNILDVITTK